MGNTEVSFEIGKLNGEGKMDIVRMTGELVKKNKKTVLVKTDRKTIKRHVLKNKVEFL